MAKRIQKRKQIRLTENSIAGVLNKEDKEFYQEVKRKTAEKFGENSLAYRTITNEIDTENVKGFQFFWNTNLGLYLPKNKNIVSLEDVEAINDLDEKFFTGFSSGIPEIILKTEKTSYDKNRYILGNLVKQINEHKYEFGSENPLRISGLELVKDENSKNEYGLLLKIGNDTKVTNDKRFVYSNDGKSIQFGEKQKRILTGKEGLSGIYLSEKGNLYSWSEVLDSTITNGWVILKEVRGVAPENYSEKIKVSQKDSREKSNLIFRVEGYS